MRTSHTFTTRIVMALALTASLAWASSPSTVLAQEQDQEVATEAAEKEAEDPGPDLELAEDADLDTLEAYIERLEQYRPTTREEYVKHFQNVQQALQEAMQRMLTKLEEAGESDSPRYYKLKRSQLMKALPRALSSAAGTSALFGEIEDYLKAVGNNLGPDDAQMAVMAGYYISNSQLKDETKQEVCNKLAELLRGGGESVASSAEMLEGIARGLAVVGEQFELKGTTLGGKEFAIGDLKGKVVLIDFWATWCGPCIAEHPNLEKNYATYQSQGFEIVGVSLDRDRSQLENFCEEHDTKWIVLHDEDGKNPATTYYGVVGIPSMFLLDQSGKVVATNVRGPRLAVELAKLLGAPESTEETEETAAEGSGE